MRIRFKSLVVLACAGVTVLVSGLLAGCSSDTSPVKPGSSKAASSKAASSTATQSAAATAAATLPSSSSGASSIQPSVPGAKPGAEGETSKTAGSAESACPFASSASVGSAFGGRVGSSTVSTSPVGAQMCTFTLVASNVNATGTVRANVVGDVTPDTFNNVQRDAHAATPLSGVGDRAFYSGATSTITFLKNGSLATIQVSLNLVGGTKYAPQIQSDLTALAKVVAAQL